MSCYICDRETWVKVLEAWRRDGEALRQIPTEQEIKEAWRAIVSANIEAWNTRYPDDVVSLDDYEKYVGDIPKMGGVMGGVIVEAGAGFCPATKRELFDAIQEYQYQCNEGDYNKREGYYKCNWVKDNWLRQFLGSE